MTLQIEIVLELDKETKNTVRYGLPEGEEAPVTSLYIAKADLPKPFPTAIRLVVEDL